MRYNAAEAPAKMGTFSQYPPPRAGTLRRDGPLLRRQGKDDKEVFENFIKKLDELKDYVGVKKTIADYGVDEEYFLDTLDEMTEQAFNDQCTGANPRYPLMSEIKELYLDAYYGREPQDYAVLLVLARLFAGGVHGCTHAPAVASIASPKGCNHAASPIPRPSSSVAATRSFTTWVTRSSRSLTRPSPSPTCSTRL